MEQVPEPARRYESYTHEAMAAEVAVDNDPAAAGEIGAQWAALGARLSESMAVLSAISERSREDWQGPAADAMRDALSRAADWSGQASDISCLVSDAVTAQAGIAARARAEMPPPVDFDPGRMIHDAVASGNFLQLIELSDALSSRRDQAQTARAKAIEVMRARDAALRAAVPPRSFPAPEAGPS
jgi:PPE-repeat protein